MDDFPQPTAEQLAEAERCEQKARKCEEQREESFQRCDTDGFVSQWASGLTAREQRAKAKVLRQGGTDTFLGLFDRATGQRLPAKVISTRFGSRWMLCDPTTGKATGVFLPMGERSRKLKKLGYEEREEVAKAAVRLTGSGRGLSGTAWVEVYRTDGGWPGAPDWRRNEDTLMRGETP
jgi:hypothetical protein